MEHKQDSMGFAYGNSHGIIVKICCFFLYKIIGFTREATMFWSPTVQEEYKARVSSLGHTDWQLIEKHHESLVIDCLQQNPVHQESMTTFHSCADVGL